MFNQLINRENKIFEILQRFNSEKLDFIVVGGYAVSAFKHRYSIDADLVIKKEDKEKFEKILVKMKLKRIILRELEHVYAPEFIRYETEDQLPVSIDLLIDGIGSRTTNASFSFSQLKENSEKKTIIGTEKQVEVIVPKKEILIVLKLHSGRLTDFRDIVAITKNIDIKLIRKLIWRGEKTVIKNNIKKLLFLLEDKGFIDSFKGVFVEKKYDVDLKEIRKFSGLIN